MAQRQNNKNIFFQSRGRNRLEPLEPRHMLAFSLWSDLLGLSISFAPDGVDIAGEPNQLAQTMDAAFPDQDWQATILSGFQKWASQTNSDVYLVEEDGAHPFGVEGNRVVDLRFGDVRIGARPLSPNIRALTIPSDSLLSGTWAGDVIINSNGSFESMDNLLAVALHEAGHAFGLPNSNLPDSAMNSRADVLITSPSSDDIRAINELSSQSVRTVDFNDTVDQATQIDLVEKLSSSSFPYYHSGDIKDGDVDYFAVTLPECCTDSLKVVVRSKGISLLSPELIVLDSDQNLLARRESTSTRGDVLEVDFRSIDYQGEEIYLRVASPRSDEYGRGSYEVRFSNDATFLGFDDQVLRFVRVAPIPKPSGDNEFDFARESFIANAATRLLNVPNEFETQVLSFPTDLSASSMVQAHVSRHALEPSDMLPNIQFATADGEIIESQVLVSDGLERIIQAASTNFDLKSFLHVTPRDKDAVGDFRVTIQFSDSNSLEEFVRGQVTPEDPHNSHPFHVSVSEINHFSFGSGSGGGSVLAVIRDFEGNIVRSIQSSAGETKTASGVFLHAGEYQVDVIAAPNLSGSLSYSMTRSVVSDPFGVSLIEPNDLDFSCPNVADAFCYPGGIQTDQPDLWEEFLDDQPEQPTVPTEQQPEVFLGPWWNWYWNKTQPESNSPPLAIADQYRSNESRRLSIDSASGLLNNDVDPNSDEILATIHRKPTHGQLALNSDGSFEYRPFPGFVGQDSFDYRITDGEYRSQIGTVTIDVTTPVRHGDYNADGEITATDIDIVAAAVRSGEDIRFDLNQSGAVNEADFNHMITRFANSVAGDANLDGDVNAIDLNAVGKHWLKNVTSWSQGDFTGDGIVDALDLNKIGQNWVREDEGDNTEGVGDVVDGARRPRAAIAGHPLAGDATRQRQVNSKPLFQMNAESDETTDQKSFSTARMMVDLIHPSTRERMSKHNTSTYLRRDARWSIRQTQRDKQTNSDRTLLVDAALRTWSFDPLTPS